MNQSRLQDAEGMLRNISSLNEVVVLVNAALYLFFGAVAVIGNSAMIWAFWRTQKVRRRSANKYTIALAFNNVALGLIAVRMCVVFLWKPTITNWYYCQAQGFIESTLHLSVLMLVAAQVADVYVVLEKVGSKNKVVAFFFRRPLVVLLMIGLHSALWASLPLTPWIPSYAVDPLIASCLFDRNVSSPGNVLYVTVMALTAFVLPSIFLVWLFAKIVEKARRRPGHSRALMKRKLAFAEVMGSSRRDPNFDIRLHSLTNDYPSWDIWESSVTTVDSNEQNRNKQPWKYSPEYALAKSAVIFFAPHVISWVPFLLVVLLNLAGYPVNEYLILISLLMAKLSCVHSTYAYLTDFHYRVLLGVSVCDGA